MYFLNQMGSQFVWTLNKITAKVFVYRQQAFAKGNNVILIC